MKQNVELKNVKLGRHLSVAGYSRSIPGTQTYRMDGVVSLGEHHLVIDEVQLSDDGQFECQVTRTKDDEELRGFARLSVIGELSVQFAGLHSGSFHHLVII